MEYKTNTINREVDKTIENRSKTQRREMGMKTAMENACL
jgi:hypothetical protein